MKVIAVSADTLAGASAMQSLVGDAINVLVDDSSVIDALGLLEIDGETARLVARPTTYIIDGAGVVRYRYVGRSHDDRPKNALLVLAVESLHAQTMSGE